MALHLFFLCPYAVEMWYTLASVTGQVYFTPEMSVQQIWLSSWARLRNQRPSRPKRKAWEAVFAAAIWLLWKQRNKVVFGGYLTTPNLLAREVVVESNLWLHNPG
ncbi:hypothetical protein FCM35_KLT13524 [Carex littledalei]|uniref:Uncharacterized protein n=1 Tax=Carex littledalei TaxID=544730 RepID=A0A833QEY3_9POAL|nr:hypothetical protein FCM35_KLT13524 [Carex littledalei]